MMPQKTGFEVCQALRADDALQDTLVLMLTAKGRDTDVAKGLGVGADAYMTKPFSTKELVHKVRELLARRPRPHEARERLVARWRWRAALAAVLLPLVAARAVWADAGDAERAALARCWARACPAGDAGAGAGRGCGRGAAAVPALGRRAGAAARAGAGAAVDRRAAHAARRRRSAACRALAQAINELARAARPAARTTSRSRWREASRSVEQERNRLAALMSELTQSVVVCNLDGRILLYNNRARMQFRALSDAPALADGAELIGLGRSIYTVFDRKLIAHALESVQQRLQRGAASPSAQFVTTTRSGQLLRAQMAPVRGVPAADGGEAAADHRLRADARQHHARLRATSPRATGCCTG